MTRGCTDWKTSVDLEMVKVYILKIMKIINDLVASMPPELVAKVLVYLSAEYIEVVMTTKIVVATDKGNGNVGDRRREQERNCYSWMADNGVEICWYHNVAKQASLCGVCREIVVMTCPQKGNGSKFTQMKCLYSDEACGFCQAPVCTDCCSDRNCMECGIKFCVGVCSNKECKFCFL